MKREREPYPIRWTVVLARLRNRIADDGVPAERRLNAAERFLRVVHELPDPDDDDERVAIP